MSRLWPERVLIALAPRALAFARIRRTPRPVLASHRTVECVPTAGAQPWHAVIAALASFAESLNGERAAVTIMVSNHFVRYLPVPAAPGLETDEEELAFARFCFAKIHGERSKAWRIRIDRGDPGSARVASAVDDELLQAICGCFKPGAKARLVSVQPYLMTACNRWRREIPGRAGSLLVVEPGRACIARLENGRWSAVHSARGSFDAPGEWEDFLERERLATAGAAAPAEVLVQAPPTAALTPNPANTWRFRPVREPVITGLATRPDPYLAMALCAS